MNHQVKISVIVPIYNGEKYLRRCLDSILCQTFTDFELLLINDGSKDSSGAICDEYAARDSRVRVFHKENGGVSSARNVGLDNMRGEWVTFCDCDDWVYPTWIENYMSNCDDYQLVSQGIMSTKEMSKFSIKNESGFETSFSLDGNVIQLLDKLLKYNLIGYLVLKAFRTELICELKIRFDESLTYKEDEVFVLDYLKGVKRAKVVKDVGYFYNVPSWGHKYKYEQTHDIYLAEQIYLKMRSIYYENLQIGKRYKLEDLKPLKYAQIEYEKECLNSYNKKGFISRVKNLRTNIGRDILVSNIFLPTKVCLYFDKTSLISSVFLKLHMLIKKTIKCSHSLN